MVRDEPLVANVHSHRLARGYANPRAVGARGAQLTKRMSAEEAFRATVLECLAQIGANAPVARARNPRGVHQLRVGLRRLQTAFKAFGEYADMPVLKTLDKRGRSLANALGPTRELDVLAEELLPQIDSKFTEHESFVALQLALRDARSVAWDDALAEVDSAQFVFFLNDVAAVAEMLPQQRTRIGKIAGRSLDKFCAHAKKHAKRLRPEYDARVHKLRIALKKLRYASEFFAPLYSKRKTEGYIKQLKLLLDDLGAANDAHGCSQTLDRLTDGAQLCFAKGVITGWYALREKRLRRRAMKNWRSFKRRRPFWV